MKTVLMLILSVVVLSGTGFAGGYAPTEWYVYGHKITPEEPQLDTRDGKEVVTVNGIQVFPLLKPEAQKAVAPVVPTSEETSRHGLMMAADQYKNSLLLDGVDASTAMQMVVEFFLNSALVSEAYSVDEKTIDVQWQGETGFEGLMFSFTPPVPAEQAAAEKERIYLERVQQKLAELRRVWRWGFLVLIDNGTIQQFPPNSPEFSLDDVRAEIAAAQGLVNDEDFTGSMLDRAIVKGLRTPRVSIREE